MATDLEFRNTETCCGIQEIGEIYDYPAKFGEFLSDAFRHMRMEQGSSLDSFQHQAIIFAPTTPVYRRAIRRMLKHGWKKVPVEMKRGDWHIGKDRTLNMYIFDFKPYYKEWKKYLADHEVHDDEF